MNASAQGKVREGRRRRERAGERGRTRERAGEASHLAEDEGERRVVCLAQPRHLAEHVGRVGQRQEGRREDEALHLVLDLGGELLGLVLVEHALVRELVQRHRLLVQHRPRYNRDTGEMQVRCR